MSTKYCYIIIKDDYEHGYIIMNPVFLIESEAIDYIEQLQEKDKDENYMYSYMIRELE